LPSKKRQFFSFPLSRFLGCGFPLPPLRTPCLVSRLGLIRKSERFFSEGHLWVDLKPFSPPPVRLSTFTVVFLVSVVSSMSQ